jgi:hypothetical protein
MEAIDGLTNFKLCSHCRFKPVSPMASKIVFKVPELLKNIINMVDTITPFKRYGMIKMLLNRFNPRNLPFTKTANTKANIN